MQSTSKTSAMKRANFRILKSAFTHCSIATVKRSGEKMDYCSRSLAIKYFSYYCSDRISYRIRNLVQLPSTPHAPIWSQHSRVKNVRVENSSFFFLNSPLPVKETFTEWSKNREETKTTTWKSVPKNTQPPFPQVFWPLQS